MKKTIIFICIAILLTQGSVAFGKSEYEGKGEMFMSYDVSLTKGMFKQSQKVGLDYLLSFDVDRLLAPLYATTEYISPANEYSGWESLQISGHTIGHYLSACAYMYAQTGNTELLKIMEHVVSVMAKLQRDDGFLAAFKSSYLEKAFDGKITAGGSGGAYLNGCWAPWYNMHKTFQALMDVYTFTDNTAALDTAVKLGNYIANGCDKMSDEQMQKMLEGEHGGIMEAFVNLYNITKNERYLGVAKRWTHRAITDPLANGEDKLTGIHGNTQIPKIIGCIKYYKATGDEYYYRVAKNFWNFTVSNRSYIFGGNTRSEHFDPIGTEETAINTAETCNTYNMLKLTAELFSVDKSSEYAQYYENALFNHILSSQDPESGAKIYFLSTLPGQFKIYCTHDTSFWCCTGTGMENPGRYSDFIYAHDNDCLYVNLFINSTINWSDKKIKLEQTTDFPEGGNVKITITEADNVNMGLKIRIPQWCDEMSVKVNEEAAEVVSENGYMTIMRKWNSADEVEISVPMHVSVYKSRESDDKKEVIGFKYGPIVLAGVYGKENMPESDLNSNHSENANYPAIKINPIVTDEEDISKLITKSDGKMEFIMEANQPGIGKSTTRLYPLYDVHHERYTVYWTKYTCEQYENADKGSSAEERLFDATVDMVEPALQQSETDHGFAYEGVTDTGYLGEALCSWRDIKGKGYISYDLKVKDGVKNYLLTLLWGSDSGNEKNERMFDIMVDSEVIATYTVESPAKGRLYYLYYEIPPELIKGKDSVKVMYRSNAENTQVGGIYGVRITTEKIDPYEGMWEACRELESFYDLGASNNEKIQITEFELVSRFDKIDGIIAYTNSETAVEKASWKSLGIILKLNKNGKFEAIDADKYRTSDVSYEKNTLYHVKIAANIESQKYDVYINDALVFSECRFRSSAEKINNIGRLYISGGSGAQARQFYIKNHVVYPAGEIRIKIDGAYLQCENKPYMENDTVMVPVRKIFEALGARVEWVDETCQIIATKGESKITLQIGAAELDKNAVREALEAAPIIKDAAAYACVSTLERAMGVKATWSAENKTVIIERNN